MRVVPASMFFALAVIYAGIGIWSREGAFAAYWIPLTWATLFGLTPFSAAILCLAIGVIYLAVDRKSSRRASMIIAFAQLAAFVLGIAGYAAVGRFLWIATGPNPTTGAHFPLRSAGLAALGIPATLLLFAVNLWWMRRPKARMIS